METIYQPPEPDDDGEPGEEDVTDFMRPADAAADDTVDDAEHDDDGATEDR